MEYAGKPKGPTQSEQRAVTPGALAQRLPPPEIKLQRQRKLEVELTRFTARPLHLQRQVTQPVLRAAELHSQEVQRVEGPRVGLQRQASELAALLPTGAVQRALQRQIEREAPVVAPALPQLPGDWVTVIRAQAQSVQAQQDAGRGLDPRQSAGFTALQRQVAQTLVQGYRQDRQAPEARQSQYAGHLLSLQRHPLSAPVVRGVLGMLPPVERLSLQRAVDTALQREREQEEQDAAALRLHTLQRQLAELDAETTQPVFQRIQARRGAGSPLPAAIQRHLEQGLNHDLSRVRIHDDAEADVLAKGVNATAFTTGSDIFFRAGTFNPNSQSGLELLAHEVTHTVQQAQGRVGTGVDPDAGLEAEARASGVRLSRIAPTVPGVVSPRKAIGLRPVVTASLQRKASTPPSIRPSSWRQSGKLRGNPPIRDEAAPPNPNIVEDEKEYRVLVGGARQLLQAQRQRAQKLQGPDRKGVKDYRFWFARVYSYVTDNEIVFAEHRTFDYPSYVMQCVMYFDKLYADNLTAVKAKVEPHWSKSFEAARNMQEGDYLPTQVGAAVWSLVSAMLAHIRFDLPRAEAWVAQRYGQKYGAKPSDFRADFFRMGGVFDNASRSMFADMQRLLPDMLNFGPWAVKKMSDWDLTPGAMRHLLGADMSEERLTTWRRMEALVAQGRTPPNPYAVQGGRLTGTVVAKDGQAPGASTAPLNQLSPPGLRPSMRGIDANVPNRLWQGVEGVIGSQIDTGEGQIALWQGTFGDPARAKQVPVYERATILLALVRNPGMALRPMPVTGVLPVDSPRDDALIVSILKASQAQGDLALLVDMVDAHSLLKMMEVDSQRQTAELLFARKDGYYHGLGVMNATNQIQKWFEAGDGEANRRSAQRIFRALSSSVQQEVARLLAERRVPERMFR